MSDWLILYGSKDELYHHGIKGQKWGIRRYQDEYGSLTPEGLIRYSRSNRALTRGLNAASKQSFKGRNRMSYSQRRYFANKDKNPKKADKYLKDFEENGKYMVRGMRATDQLLNTAIGKNKLVRMENGRVSVEMKNIPKEVQLAATHYAGLIEEKLGTRSSWKVSDDRSQNKEDEFFRVTTPTSVEERANGSDPFKTTTIYGKHDDDDRHHKNGGR